MEKVIDAGVARRHRRAARRTRAGQRRDAARRHRAAARADGRGAGPAPAAALHRGARSARRSPDSAAGSADASRAVTRSPTSRPSCGRSGRGPIATRYDRVTFDLEHVLDGTGARAELLAPGHPLHDAVIDADRHPIGVRRSSAAPSLSPRRWRSRTCSSASSRRLPTPPTTAVARRFGYAYVDELRHRRGRRARPVSRLRRRPADHRGHSGPRRCPGWPRPRNERRAGSSPTSSPSTCARSRPAARPSCTASAIKSSTVSIRRTTASSSRRWSPKSRNRTVRNPRRLLRA